MKYWLLKLGAFCHIIDDDGRLDLTDIAFIVIMIKIALAVTLDWPAVVTLAVTILNKMQKRSAPDVAQLTGQLQDIKTKVETVVKGISS